ncbi:MAG: hypothetical protein JWN66_2410 [Sphingomonas bacterium]|nr:hypothetical protein [Sphingomonas bacterium]
MPTSIHENKGRFLMTRVRHTARTLLALSVAISALGLPGVAAAQDKPADAAAVPEDIVVTAQKREQNLQDVPVSISVVSGESLVQSGSSQLTDFAAYVPGLTVTSSGTPGQSTVALRGVTPLNTSASVGIYIDDAPVGSSTAYNRSADFALDLLPYDIQRIEVLRGPQGTLYGASSIGGLVKYVTVAPNLSEFSGRAGGELFSIDHAGRVGYAGQAIVNVPLVSGSLAATGSLSYRNTPGWIDNAATGRRDQNGYDQLGGRVSLLWQPSEAFSARLSAIWQTVDAGDRSAISETAAGVRVGNGRSNDNVVREPFSNDFQYYAGTLDYDFGVARLSSTTTYSKTTTDALIDLSRTFGVYGGAGGRAPFDSRLTLDKYTEEVRLTSPTGGMFEWMIGGFYTSEDAGHNQLVSVLTASGAPAAGLNPFYSVQIPSTYKEYAGFANATLSFGERFDLTAGLRWAHNDQTNATVVSGAALGGAVLNAGGTSSDDVFTYSVSPQFHLSKNAMLYARVASGYRPGGPNVVVPGVVFPASFDPDRLTNYELGFKANLSGVTIDLAAFRMDWNKIQVAVAIPGTVFAGIGNGATARSQGVEASLLFKPAPGLSLGLNGAYTDAKLTAAAPNIGGLDGDRLPYIPRFSGSATADYRFDLASNATLRIGGGLRYSGSRRSAVTSNPDGKALPDYAALDLNAALTFAQRYTVRLYARNVFDSDAPITRGNDPQDAGATSPMIDVVTLQPRTIGLAVDIAF